MDWLRLGKTGYSAPLQYPFPLHENPAMNHRPANLAFVIMLTLSGCGAGETAAVATLQAEQAKQAQQQMEQLKQQINLAHEKNNLRLQQATQDAQ